MKRRHPEEDIQRAVVEHLEWRGVPGLVWFAVPNGGWRSPAEAAIFKGLGVKPGVSDLILLHKGWFFALELKAGTNRVTDQQEAFLIAVMAAGGRSACANGVDEALGILLNWGLIR